LLGAVAACGGARFLVTSPAWAVSRGDPQDEEIARVREQARKAGLGTLQVVSGEHFLAVGDAKPSFLEPALGICEELGRAFMEHFKGKGFTPAFPASRLTVVGLKDDASYAKFLGEAPGEEIGGHYDLETNRLVIFDFRPSKAELGKQAERINLFTLVHETAHQLSYNTGILDRANDYPLAISEGFATYVELWRPGVKNAIGGVNKPRMQAMADSEDWIAIDDLLKDDQAFGPDTEQLAYAESWLFVHHMLRSSTRQPKLRTFLTSCKKKMPPDQRLQAAKDAFGPLAKLDRELKSEARRLLRN
jgi:hypothetical protein